MNLKKKKNKLFKFKIKWINKRTFRRIKKKCNNNEFVNIITLNVEKINYNKETKYIKYIRIMRVNVFAQLKKSKFMLNI